MTSECDSADEIEANRLVRRITVTVLRRIQTYLNTEEYGRILK